ncbi:insulin receptor substrate 1 [Labrus bergylta]|uniref:insulin receptor substrate 1 n=1 Tax=Labrus bergylta TaxID=56723 RepID=UPI003313C9A9
MNETAEEPSRSANQRGRLPASSSPLSSPTRTRLPVDPWMNTFRMHQDSLDHHVRMQSSPPSPFYEELFWNGRSLGPLVPLAGALMSGTSGPQSDVVKQGYLGKLERNHRRYYVLRGGSHIGPSRLEWYKSQEKFTAVEKSAGKTALFGSNKQGLIYLRCCLGVSRVSSSRKGQTVTLYAKDQTVVLVVEDQCEQEEWYQAIKKLMEEERKDEENGERFDEEDDGYCTLPPAAFFKEVWPVTVKPHNLGGSKSLAGESRLCLTATSLILIRVGSCSDLPSVTIPLLSVRRFGHLDGSFFLELGRSAPNGPGEIWMEARDQGNSAGAQQIHEVVRDTVKALRALPDFSRSPTSNHNQLHLASRRCRPKYRDKAVNVRPLGFRFTLPPTTPELSSSPLQSHSALQNLDEAEPDSSLSSTSSSTPETSSYMDMKMDRHPPENKVRENDCERITMVTGSPCTAAASGMENLEPSEEDEEEQGLGYMMMSPQVGSSSLKLPQDDYVTMASPHKHNLPAYTSLQTSFSSSFSDSCSPVHLSRHKTSEHSPPNWPFTSIQYFETEAEQSQRSISCFSQPQDESGQDQKSADYEQLPSRTRITSTPVKNENGSGVVVPFPTSELGSPRPVQVSPNPGRGGFSPLQAATDRSTRRSRLSLCLPSCFQAEDGS